MTYNRRVQTGILIVAGLAALCTARPYAGSWNDGSRFAMVESLGDRGTFQIDDSIYVHPETAAIAPYAPGDDLLAHGGTKDKLYIDGHYYSDKSPVPGAVMAGAYKLMRWCGLPPAHARPDWFALAMTWLFAGVPYVLAVWGVSRIVWRIGVPTPWDVLLTTSFAFGSLATPYAEQVNNHLLLLAVAVWVCERLIALAGSPLHALGPATDNFPTRKASEGWRLTALGTLTGLGYTIDLGAGPLLLAAVGGYLLWRRAGIVTFVLTALPWVAAHHALNYAISGSLAPANANPEFFRWPGSPFSEDNMTGAWRHASPERAAVYALDLLFGKKGFLLFSLPLMNAVLGADWIVRHRFAERPILIALTLWAIGTWLLYSATSTNHSGNCLSIRWFVPLLVPGFVALMILVRDYPRSRSPLLVLIAGSLILNVELVYRGPWWPGVPLLLWPICGLSLTVWVISWLRHLQSSRRSRIATSLSKSAHRELSRGETTE